MNTQLVVCGYCGADFQPNSNDEFVTCPVCGNLVKVKP